MTGAPQPGDFVRVRTRRWLVEDERTVNSELRALRLACVDDDAQGETVELLWDAELDGAMLADEGWSAVSKIGTDDPTVFSAYLRTLRWNTATAADRDLFQAPFRAGIHQDAYQLLPLRKALRLPRINLLIADDVGAGKTVEAGLVLREMLLRRRVNFVLVAAPAGMVRQWQDELEAKFGLSFVLVDREYLTTLRRERGYTANPWSSGSRFIISHSLMVDETYVGGLRDLLGEFRAQALLILDEAHHAAPASGSRYAIDSQFTRAVRGLASRFEHRLFLSATPHNGHSNSFSSLLEILDPQRFTRGVPVRPGELDAVMVRRLKSDLRHFGEKFPERVVEPIVLDNLREDAPELVLARKLAEYGEIIRARAANLPARQAGNARLGFIGLQQRLLSSIAAFARTLEVHRKGLDRADGAGLEGAAETFVQGGAEPEDEPIEEDGEKLIQDDEDAAAEAAGAISAAVSDLAIVTEMLEIAREHAQRPDGRIAWLADWVRTNMAPGGRWNEHRLVLFTEYEDTRRWFEKRLAEALDDLQADDRIASFTGATPLIRREELKRRFNADPAQDPLRILICTDAAREGINLQMRCHDLIHIDLPWNPARLEQRNGRIDRKLQPSLKVWCRYFVHAQREEDVVLEALVRKTELIRTQLGSAGQVIAHRLSDRLEREGITRPKSLAREIDEEVDEGLQKTAVAEMDDETRARRARQAKDIDDLRETLERSREKVGVDPDGLCAVFATALARAGISLDSARAGEIGGTPLFNLDPNAPLFASGGWPEALDDLRIRRRKRSEKLKDWRAEVPLRSISFRPALTEDTVDAEGVLQLHLEHRLVRRLLSRFLSQGFASGLSRACVVVGPGAQPRVILLGRLALYGPGAARLHEEIILVTSAWTEAGRGTKPLKPFGNVREEATLDQLDQAFRNPRSPAGNVVERIRQLATQDAADLEPELRQRAEAQKAAAIKQLLAVGEAEAKSLRRLLEDQHKRVARADAESDDKQLSLLPELQAEAEQRRRDRRHWKVKLEKLTTEIEQEPERVRRAYSVVADRLETIGLVYLWPETN
ncbi:DISARM system SNF2-like helicase DrmD [Bradyrhizobium pachyrhizi]|uniref:DISARM system SNF2-like helicase DrmD n=1 Tax=Bradyrhizobium pachyrhizi TaxID=280333 RepID=UPI0024B04108|nr:DISARM system SNF2-like helicase DrmD [Bradyrhizobium pachyrhizi]WFU56825.1 DISARM system SNF2-like helicase DrmD [Bradyrhizobium pachyrhizi]